MSVPPTPNELRAVLPSRQHYETIVSDFTIFDVVEVNYRQPPRTWNSVDELAVKFPPYVVLERELAKNAPIWKTILAIVAAAGVPPGGEGRILELCLNATKGMGSAFNRYEGVNLSVFPEGADFVRLVFSYSHTPES